MNGAFSFKRDLKAIKDFIKYLKDFKEYFTTENFIWLSIIILLSIAMYKIFNRLGL